MKSKPKIKTTEGGKVLLTRVELASAIADAEKALAGDSNDAEHDALFSLKEWLEGLYEDPARSVK